MSSTRRTARRASERQEMTRYADVLLKEQGVSRRDRRASRNDLVRSVMTARPEEHEEAGASVHAQG